MDLNPSHLGSRTRRVGSSNRFGQDGNHGLASAAADRPHMLAKAPAKVPPEAEVWSYEPKWNGRVH